MTRTVIRFDRVGKSVNITLDRAPVLFDPDSWKVNLQKVPGGTSAECGQELVKLLLRREPVKTVLGSAFRSPIGTLPSPLYFHIRALAADAIPWEQLHVKDVGFCALDARWPIGRIAGRARVVRGRVFQPPLRIVAVLSAAGRDGSDELRAIIAAIKNANMPVQFHVITGDQNLLDANVGQSNVTLEQIKGTSPGLCDQIAAANPHVLHVLCHGGVIAGVRLLNFGLIDDFDNDRDEGSLRVPVDELVTALEACDPWLVVLAACESAQATPIASGRALAHDMVAKGVTAVIGMRRLVDLNATNRFCEALYPEVLAEIRRAIQPPAPGESAERTIDWAVTLTKPRKVMRDGDPGADSWLDPVLYAQYDDLRVLALSGQLSPGEIAELQGKLDRLRQFLATQDRSMLEPGVEAEVREAIFATEAKLAVSELDGSRVAADG